MLLSLLLANIRILSCFSFYFLVIFSNFLTIPVVREKNKVRLALTVPSGAPTIVVNEISDTPPLVPQLKLDQHNQKTETYLLNFLLHDFQSYLFHLIEILFVQIKLFCQLLQWNYFHSVLE